MLSDADYSNSSTEGLPEPMQHNDIIYKLIFLQ